MFLRCGISWLITTYVAVVQLIEQIDNANGKHHFNMYRGDSNILQISEN